MNPNLWSNINNMHEDAAYVVGSSIPFNSLIPQNSHQPPPSSWSQLLFSGAPGEEQRMSYDHFQANKLGTWEHQQQVVVSNNNPSLSSRVEGFIKQEASLYGHGGDQEFQGANWSHNYMALPSVSSSPASSCLTSFTTSNNNTLLDSLCNYNKPHSQKNHLPPSGDHSSESSTTTVGICKKARVQTSSSQPPLKVRKEKLGDRISALHQLVSPFGKTDTASVLLEAIGYVRFLHGQIEALCFPYFGNSSKNLRNNHFVNHGESNSVFPEDPGQLLNNDSSLKRNGAPSQENGEEKAKELRSKGLCLVPMSLIHHFGSDHNNIGADFWSSTYATGF